MEPIFELNIFKPKVGEGTLVEHFSRQLKQAIVEQRLKSGSQLPSTRAFSRNFKIARNSAIAIYETLACEGYVQTKPGGGTFVSYHPPVIKNVSNTNVLEFSNRLNEYWRKQQHQSVLPTQPNATFDFRIGFPCLEYFPFDTWRKLLAKSARKQATTLNFDSNPQGHNGLRDAIANHLSVSRAIACEGSEIVVTSGAQQALDLLARILVTPGVTKVAMDVIGYPMARCVFEAAGAIIVPIDMDEQGMQIASIPEEVSVVYVTPSHQFPYGVALSASRRSALLALAKSYGMSIIEDDYDSEFRISSGPVDALKTLDLEHGVFYVGTFSKCMLPDIRIGFVLVPDWARQSLIKAKFQTDWFCPTLIQASLAEFISLGYLAKYLRKMRRVYSKRYETLLAACEIHGQGVLAPIPINAGVHMTAMVIEPFSAFKASTILEQKSVTIKSLAHFSPTQISHHPNGLVFGFGSIKSSQIEEGVKQVVAALKYH
jgi:GntR family transcriptional regulator/MocR family aminotransferase